MLASETGARRTIGVDASEDYLARARAAAPGDDGIGFVRHDVTATPFPWGDADVIYARYVLAHLPDPLEVIERWRSQLRAGGVLLVDETSGIETDIAVFARYLQLVTAMLDADGVEMYAGRLLGEMPGETVRVSQPVDRVARMFALNLSVWRTNPHVQANAAKSEVDGLAAALDELTTTGSERTGSITWTMRQVRLPATAR
jgi:SAM-dependent methyltransferase